MFCSGSDSTSMCIPKRTARCIYKYVNLCRPKTVYNKNFSEQQMVCISFNVHDKEARFMYTCTVAHGGADSGGGGGAQTIMVIIVYDLCPTLYPVIFIDRKMCLKQICMCPNKSFSTHTPVQ